MKSRFKYLPLVLLLASCSVELIPQAEQEAPEAVNLGTLVSSPRVKGTGPVDEWKADMPLYIYGIQRLYENEQSSPNILDFRTAEGKCFIENEMVYAPTDGTEVVHIYNKPELEEPYFYQEGRRYEFFGYFTDGAATAAPTTRESRIDIPVKIDGTQDVMSAVTDKVADLGGRTFSESRLYSAYSARKGVVPKLLFGHQLSRFNFYITSIDGLSEKVTLTRLQVNSNTTGTVVIANKDNNVAPGLDMETLAAPEWLFAIDPQGQRITKENGIQPQKDSWSFIGSVMVMPGHPVYNFLLGIVQDGFTDTSFPSYNKEFEDIESSFSIDFKDLQNYSEDPKYGGDTSKDVEELDASAVKGHQYDVNIVVYGLQQVRVNVSLTPWEDGGSIMVDQDPSGPVNLEILNVSDLEIQKGHITGLMPVAKIPAAWDPEKKEFTEYKDFDGELRYSFESADPTIVETDSAGMVSALEVGETKVLITVVSAEEGKAKGRRTIKVKVTE